MSVNRAQIILKLLAAHTQLYASRQALGDAAEVLAGGTRVKTLETMEGDSRADVEVAFNNCIGALRNEEIMLPTGMFVLTL